MRYYKNFMADAVVRVDGNRRYAKRTFDPKEKEFISPNSTTVFGGESYGVFYILEPITKEQYETFEKTWTFDRYGKIKSIKK